MTNNQRIVIKFGGKGLKDAEAIKNVADIIAKYDQSSILVVVSAIGDTTDQLEQIVRAFIDESAAAPELLEQIKRHHYQILSTLIDPLPIEKFNLINDTFVEVEWALEDVVHEDQAYVYDQIVSVGELLSSQILHAYLNHIGISAAWLDVRDVITTDNQFQQANVLTDLTQDKCTQKLIPLFDECPIVITQGFIGSTTENFTSTLGRGGTDYSAAILAAAIKAHQMVVWKDVNGVF